MGSQESKSSRNNVSQDDFKKLLEEQKRQYLLLKAQQIKDQQKAEQAVRNAVEKEMEKIRQESKVTKESASNSNEPTNQSESTLRYERTPRMHSFTHNEIHLGTTQPTRTSVYQNLESPPTGGMPVTTCSQQSPFTTPGVVTTGTGIIPTASRSHQSTTTPESYIHTPNETRLNVIEDFCCLTCKRGYTATIYQCSRGHSSCSDCKGQGSPCGICGFPIGDIRNVSLEGYIAEKKVPCANANDGCRLYIKMADLDKHGTECPFREMLCPLAAVFGQCQWRGKLPHIAQHFNNFHSQHCNADVDTEMFLTRNEKQLVYYVSLGSFHFLFHVKVSDCDCRIYMTVQMIGTKQGASKWSYEIHVYNKDEPRRKYQHIDVCHSNNISITEIFAEGKCAVIPLTYAETFYNKDRFNYKFYIKKDVGNKSSKSQGGARRRCQYR